MDLEIKGFPLYLNAMKNILMILSSWLGMKPEAADANENSKQSPDSKIEEKKPAPESQPKSSKKSAKANANVNNNAQPKPRQNMSMAPNPAGLPPPLGGSTLRKFNPPPLPKRPYNQMPNFLPNAQKNSSNAQSTDPSTVDLASTRAKVRHDTRFLY